MTAVHVGALKGERVADLKLDGLVLIDYGNHHAVHALGMCPDPGLPFAVTGRGYQIFACGGSDVPTERFAIHAGGAESMTEEGVAELMFALNGLGAVRVGLYVGFEFTTEYHGENFLQQITEWLGHHPNNFQDVYVLSPTKHLQCQFPHYELNRSCVRWAGCEHCVAEANEFQYYFDMVAQGSVAVTGVVWTGSDALSSDLIIPEMFDVGGRMVRVTEIRETAFDETRDEDCTWRDNIRRIVLPRYVNHVNLRLIAQRFANLDEIVTDAENHHLRTREWHCAVGGREDYDEITRSVRPAPRVGF